MICQLVEFFTSVPNLQDFTVCYWLKSVNTTTRQSTFSYAGNCISYYE